ncbi:hypothetical protein [Ruthenibacterium lactatiformans]|uniref:hypothetical protein n=1 Tax=Ruthenibacterium lactatiformans TaxID=1550024 RepID=UPI001968593B|nr:hypothetical protein [Ruthenibacterium lactatiformans]MBN3028381.1 hypothetical protein [Ruthenibacterium lactatiformans]
MLRRVEKIRLCLRRSRRQGRPPAQPAPAAQGNKVLRAAARTALRARMVLGAQQQSILRGQGFRLQHFVRRPAQQTERFPGQHHAMQRIHAAVFPKVHDKTPSDNLIKFILTKTAGREQ